MVASILIVTAFAIVTSFILVLPYKFLMNQGAARSLRERVNELNKQIKEAQKNKKADESTKLLSALMEEQGKLMQMTTKPMLVTFALVLLILPFFANLYVHHVSLVEPSSLLQYEKQGEMVLATLDGKSATLQKNTPTIVETPDKIYQLTYKPDQSGWLGNTKEYLEVEEVVARSLVPLPFTGTDVGWLGWYILVGIPFNMIFRKLFNLSV